MDRSTTPCLIFHYLLLLILIFGVIAAVDRLVEGVDLLVGLAIAVIIGLAYPRVAVAAGVAPSQ